MVVVEEVVAVDLYSVALSCLAEPIAKPFLGQVTVTSTRFLLFLSFPSCLRGDIYK